ncbi:MAG: beta-lactamase family protein [Limnochordia bacterium]|nr:beta-lactamase family protein [Limnochordia bacterium]
MAARKRKLIVKIAVSVVIIVAVALGGIYLYSSWQMSKIPSMSFKDMLHYTTKGNENALITVGILKDGEIAYTVYGYNGTVVPQDKYDYEIGSLTKTFTTSLLCKAIQEEKIDLDAQINQYLLLPTKGYYPTLKRLVTHTSGYREYYLDWHMAANFLNGQDNDYYGITLESLNKKVGKINLEDKDHPFRWWGCTYGT